MPDAYQFLYLSRYLCGQTAAHLSERHHVCLRVGGPLIYSLSVALRHVPIEALISWLIVWNGALPTLTTQCYDWHASPPCIELSPLICLSQWGQLSSTVVWTTVEWGRCKWTHPAHYSRQKNYENLLEQSSALSTAVKLCWVVMLVKCCKLILPAGLFCVRL